MSNTCANCTAPADLTICWTCAKTLRRHLVGDSDDLGLVWYITRLRESAYGESRIGRVKQRVGGQGETPAPPFNWNAAKVLRKIERNLADWLGASTVAPSFIGPLQPGIWRAGASISIRAIIDELARNIATLMARPDAGDIMHTLDRLRADAEKAIDLPPDLQYVGPCPTVHTDGAKADQQCSVGLYVEREDDIIRCPRCKTIHDVTDLRQAALDRVDDEPKSASEMLRLLKWLERPIPAKSTFYKLVGRIPPRMYLHRDGKLNHLDAAGATPLYAYSEVVSALDAFDEAASDRRGKRQKRKVAA
jgi:hypothetical protein